MNEIEIWASPEPTIARVNRTNWRNQLAETGHGERASDIDLLASLDIKATRYPVLWEAVAPVRPAWRDYRWSDQRLKALAGHNIEPIVTLLHHGSGPAYTNLVDPAFPELFAAYAASTAARYPWVRRWTPINEPLTTARFSTLYGTWYPNRTDHEAFGHALFNEALGTVLAMRDIRKHIPAAELVLTEDLQGFYAADPAVADYVAHKSERRFLSAELILGRVTQQHALWKYLVDTCNVPARDLERLRWLSFPISLMGWNYYPNSERVLASSRSGVAHNDALVDVDPARLDCHGRLMEAWERLKIPMGLTEVHCIGNQHERSRWMLQRYADALDARAAGADIRAFGAWAAFGMIDWCSLLCRNDDVREDGIFTCAPGGAEPQPTIVADTVRALANGSVPLAPPERGWWELPRAA